ncbi:MAG: phosphate/phosphite/phosphonate ABC transporter substrate-binding protein [Methylomonas sp.]|uniref:phosphate/phosphite/phosphonate ABC transporter substrate-binding protein n=1 Tax=Methylomonas sp. TaxID=418 RepID=UPI0025D0AC68|nr:phosphate/phosphite/phosphonate ABC transporter substrate-binding protein [Methylomonas sp.]MCK9606607.1 phosphate/phosphite/phosphonate ABC transporter substrate-binding protein [Methylomonas sp.]
MNNKLQQLDEVATPIKTVEGYSLMLNLGRILGLCCAFWLACLSPVCADTFYTAGVEGWLHNLQDYLNPHHLPHYQPTFSTEPRVQVKEYIVGIHPLHNPKRLFEVYGPIVEHINQHMPEVEFKLEASRNYQEFDKKLYGGYFDIAMPNPYQTINALQHGYRVFGKMADDEDFRGIILVRKDSGINSVADLKGKAVSYPAKTALAATMMPQYFLHTHGLDVNKDIENRYVGSQESSIMNVLMGDVAAAATWPVPWKLFLAEHPEQAAELEVKWQTEPLQNNGWVVRKDIPVEVIDNFSRLLFSLQDSDEGRAMLAAVPVSRFEVANNQTYAPVEAFLQRLNQTLHLPRP